MEDILRIQSLKTFKIMYLFTHYNHYWRAYFNCSIHPGIYNTMINVVGTGLCEVFTVFPCSRFFPLFVCSWTWWNNLCSFSGQGTICLLSDSILDIYLSIYTSSTMCLKSCSFRKMFLQLIYKIKKIIYLVLWSHGQSTTYI